VVLISFQIRFLCRYWSSLAINRSDCMLNNNGISDILEIQRSRADILKQASNSICIRRRFRYYKERKRAGVENESKENLVDIIMKKCPTFYDITLMGPAIAPAYKASLKERTESLFLQHDASDYER
jgi:hypothetical protein